MPQNNKIKIRRGLDVDLPLPNTEEGELRYSKDTQKLYIDDGINNVYIGGNTDNFPISTATQTALNGKEPIIPTGTALHYIKGDKTLGTFPTIPTVDQTIIDGSTNAVSGNAVFDGLGVVQKDIAYVDINGNNATAILGNIRKPYLTIDAALDALPVGGGVVRIGIGSFNSPTPSKVKSNTSFIGSKEPIINSTITLPTPNSRPTISAPTALIDGTILTGEFLTSDKNNITIQNLGVDVGKTWVDTFNAGTPVGGLVLYSSIPTSPIKKINVNNVTVLGYAPTTAQHCMLFENVTDSNFSNLTTYYHVHGVAFKGLNSELNGVKAYSHANDGLIIKSNIYAPTRDVSVNNVVISSLSGYEGGGIILEEGVNGSSLLERISLNNINLKYVKFGLNNVNKISNVNISNFNLYDSQTFGIKFDNNVDKINLSGLNIALTGSDGIDISITGSEVVNIIDSNISSATGTGYKLTTAGNSLINVNNSNTLNTTSSYGITGTGVYGSSNFGTGTTIGYINFKNPFVKSFGRIFSVDDSSFGDLASTNGSLDMRFSNASQIATIESFNFLTGLKKPLEISSLNYNVSSSGYISATNYTGGATLTGTPTAPTAPAGTNTTQVATTAFVLANTNALPYKLATFYVNQSGTNAPTSVTLSDNTSLALSSPTWQRTGVGDYRFFIGIQSTTKVFPYVVQSSWTFGNDIFAASIQGQYIQITRRTNGVLTDGLINILFEVRQYP